MKNAMRNDECEMANRACALRFIVHHSSLILLALALTGCWKDDMGDNAHIKPLEASGFFADGKTARSLVPGTVPRGGHVVEDPIYAVTLPPATEATAFPRPLTKVDIERGQQLFNIYCSVCHGATGHGDGMIVLRGFPHPPSYYLDRLRNAPPGHFYNVLTHGHGAMYGYGDRIAEDDRWKIVAYIRAFSSAI